MYVITFNMVTVNSNMNFVLGVHNRQGKDRPFICPKRNLFRMIFLLQNTTFPKQLIT